MSAFRYFLDEDVLQRVPSMFLVLGGIFASMELLSILLIREPNHHEMEEIKDFVKTKEEKSGKNLDEKEDKEVFSLSPKEMLKTKEFYEVLRISKKPEFST